MSEEELFSDPRASLDKIAGAPPPGPRVDPSAALKGYGEVGPSMDAALRDPFRPLGSDKAIDVASPDAGAPSEPPPPPVTRTQTPTPEANADAGKGGPEQAGPLLSEPSPAPAEVAKGPAPKPRTPDVGVAEARAAQAAQLLDAVQKRLGADAQSVPGPQLDIRASDEGILISLTDRQNFSMFPIGSAEPQKRVVRMMDAIAMSSCDAARRDRGPRTHGRASVSLEDLRQLAAFLGARADGILYARARRRSREAL